MLYKIASALIESIKDILVLAVIEPVIVKVRVKVLSGILAIPVSANEALLILALSAILLPELKAEALTT